MNPNALKALVAQVTTRIAGKPLNGKLEQELNRNFGSESELYEDLRRTCEAGVDEGWLCQREAGGIRYGRVFKPADDLSGFSVDVVEMENIVGPHHKHPNGEIDLVMPLQGDASFDGQGAGWKVYGPGTAHHPTVSGGKALVLYLLPGGAIEFT
mgnify:CR=1 FL=1